jgi:carbon storage regulator
MAKNLEALSVVSNCGKLVLSRKAGQKIVIEDVVITIEKVTGNRVSVAIQASRDVRVARGELIERGNQPPASEIPAMAG